MPPITAAHGNKIVEATADLTTDGYIGIPISLTVFYDTAKGVITAGYDATPIIMYVVNTIVNLAQSMNIPTLFFEVLLGHTFTYGEMTHATAKNRVRQLFFLHIGNRPAKITLTKHPRPLDRDRWV